MFKINNKLYVIKHKELILFVKEKSFLGVCKAKICVI